MNILYLSQYFPPEACAPAARVDSFSREWARAGEDVRVVTGFPNHPEGVLHPAYRKAWRKGFYHEERQGVEVYRTWLYPSANRKLWGRGANFASFALSAAAAGTWVAPRKGVVIATSPQILVGVAGWAVGTLRRLPWVFEVRDLWPESLVGVGQASADSWLYRSVGQVADFLYRQATHIVVDGEWKRRHLIHQGVDESKITIIRNGIEEDFCLDPESGHAHEARHILRKELGLRDEFVLLYAGTLGMAHGLETLLEAAARLRSHDDIVFLIVGAGAERDQFCRRLVEMRLPNVRLLEKQRRDRIPAFLAAADACLIPLRNQEVFKTAIPSKMFEAMAAGKPSILGVEGEAKAILLHSRAGLAVPPENSQAMAGAILTLQKEPAFCRALGRNGRQAVMENYLRPTQAGKYLNLLRGLCAEPETSPSRMPTPMPEVFPPVLSEARAGSGFRTPVSFAKLSPTVAPSSIVHPE
jgi:glycosyltransferase involved in cell wall biosynthesis